MTNLTKIANKHNTDKGTVAYEKHGYTEEYSKYIPETGNYKLLEIGIWHGDSLKMWNDYNPDMIIHGIDNDVSVTRYINSFDNVHVHIGNASSPVFLDKIIPEMGEFDFIIDDGSHKYEDILESFKYLYDYLKPGGYYFIEDLHAQQAQKSRLIADIYDALEELDPDHKSLGLFCNDKLWIIQKS